MTHMRVSDKAIIIYWDFFFFYLLMNAMKFEKVTFWYMLERQGNSVKKNVFTSTFHEKDSFHHLLSKCVETF